MPRQKNTETEGEDLGALNEQYREPANLGAGETMDASGAIIEPKVVEGVDYANPAVDNDPRAHTSVAQNRIDFNDPNLSEAEKVQAMLERQGQGGDAR